MYRCGASQGVTCRYGQEEILPEQRYPAEHRSHRGGDEGHVHGTLLEHGEEVIGRLFDDDDLQIGLLCGDPTQQWTGQVGSKGGEDPHPQRGSGLTCAFARRGVNVVGQRQHLTSQFGHPHPSRSEFGSSATSNEAHTQIVLQTTNLGRQGGLAHPARLGSLTEVASVCQGDKILQLAQIHGFRPGCG